MAKENKRNSYILKVYRYFYPDHIPEQEHEDVVDMGLVRCCIKTEEERASAGAPIFSLATKAILEKHLPVNG